ncbi:MAG: NADH-quinone oxidoreductase subunit N [Planctomycetota bacterium]
METPMAPSLTDTISRAASDARLLLPEGYLILTFLAGLVLDLALPRREKRLIGYIAIVGLLGTLWATALLAGRMSPAAGIPVFSGMILLDPAAFFFKYLILAGTAVTILAATRSHDIGNGDEGIFYLLMLAGGLGAMLLASAGDLVMTYLALEFTSLTGYLLAGFLRRDAKSGEAGLKYVIFGAMASGAMIFGFSLLYGITGETSLAGVARGLAQQNPDAALLAPALLLSFAGIGYKIAAAPFHFWSPDVYEGAPTVATAFFSVVPKAAGFAVLLRWVSALAVLPGEAGRLVMWGIAAAAVLSMFIGNLTALGQTNLKRLLAFSSVAQAGYMLLGAVTPGPDGRAAVLFYLAAYAVMNLGAFLVALALENATGSAELDDLRGTVRKAPVLAIAMCVFCFALTGLPPLSGFMGKLLIFGSLVGGCRWELVLAGVLNTVLSLFYYVKVVRVLVVDRPQNDTPLSIAPLYPVLVSILAVATILLGVVWKPLYDLAAASLP